MLTRFVKAQIWCRAITSVYDKAHNFDHHLDALENVFNISASELDSEKDKEIAYLAIIIHDAFDHKEVSSQEKLEELQKDCLDHVFNGDKHEYDEVMQIITTMSYSKMAKNNDKPIPLGNDRLEKIRDVVSDGDKLEAIGQIGLQRCHEYLEGHFPELVGEELQKDVVKHFEEKLLRLDQFILTQKGGEMAKPLMKETNIIYQQMLKKL